MELRAHRSASLHVLSEERLSGEGNAEQEGSPLPVLFIGTI